LTKYHLPGNSYLFLCCVVVKKCETGNSEEEEASRNKNKLISEDELFLIISKLAYEILPLC
jgi:hypothetical protein